jgi:hypothetical protein
MEKTVVPAFAANSAASSVRRSQLRRNQPPRQAQYRLYKDSRSKEFQQAHESNSINVGDKMMFQALVFSFLALIRVKL